MKEPSALSPWSTGELKTITSTRVFDLVAATVHCPRSGMDREFYKLAASPWVNVVAVTGSGELLLIRQYRFGSGCVEIEIPGGAVDPGEEAVAAGVRELREETGYGGSDARLIGWVRPNPAILDNICSTVLVAGAERLGPPRFEDMEDIEVVALPEEKVFALIGSGAIRHGLVLNALMFYAMYRGMVLPRLADGG